MRLLELKLPSEVGLTAAEADGLDRPEIILHREAMAATLRDWCLRLQLRDFLRQKHDVWHLLERDQGLAGYDFLRLVMAQTEAIPAEWSSYRILFLGTTCGATPREQLFSIVKRNGVWVEERVQGDELINHPTRFRHLRFYD